MAKEPTLPTMLVIGAIRFRAGTKVETAQNAIDRLIERYQKMERLIWELRQFRDRLPESLRERVAEL